jgi:CarboxypepD_reg-like domain
VNIGIVGKNIGTISDENGKYNLFIDNKFKKDSLKFSCIGFEPFSIKVSDFKKIANKNIYLKEKPFELKEVFISPKKFKDKILGYTSHSKAIKGGFKENKPGYEYGVFLKIKKSAVFNKLNINVADCSYDTLFYRVNFYKVAGRMEFENILSKPIYFKIPKDKIKDKITVDLSNENIRVNGNCLVTIEHIKDLGNGYLWFSGSFPGKTYYRKTSQGIWETAPLGISLCVEAKIEQ